MFDGLINFIRKVGVKMGLIQELGTIGALKDVKLSEGMHNYIYKWRALHAGKLKDIHTLNYMTIAGPQCRDIATLQTPKVLVQEMAKLIFNERCTITISEEDKKESVFADYIGGVLDDNKFYSVFQEKLEFMFAQGGLVIKPYVKNGKIKLGYATADTFYPIQWDDTRIYGGLFVSEVMVRGKCYVHLEYHRYKEDGRYWIEHKAYAKEFEKITNEVPMSTIYPNLPVEISFETDVPLFVYIKPNIANNIDPTSPLGISIYANSLDTIKSLDTAFDSFTREYRLGRRRMIVGPSMIKVAGSGMSGAPRLYVDDTEEYYEALNGDLDNEPFKEIASNLRINEHIQGINANLAILSLQTGFDPSSFSFEKSGLKTATEVVSENSRTFKTKQSHENVIEGGLTDLVACIAAVAKINNLPIAIPEHYDVSVFFDDSIANDRMADITEQATLVTNRFQSRQRAIEKLFGYTPEEALKLMAEIDSEEAGGSTELEDYIASQEIFGEIE